MRKTRDKTYENWRAKNLNPVAVSVFFLLEFWVWFRCPVLVSIQVPADYSESELVRSEYRSLIRSDRLPHISQL